MAVTIQYLFKTLPFVKSVPIARQFASAPLPVPYFYHLKRVRFQHALERQPYLRNVPHSLATDMLHDEKVDAGAFRYCYWE